jgi:2,3-bisphosphoglycerate-independent phosphoglycerate mutase
LLHLIAFLDEDFLDHSPAGMLYCLAVAHDHHTADHGNADDMVQRDKKGKPLKDDKGKVIPLTSHTLAPVPLIITGAGLPESVSLRTDLPEAGLANVTATFINLLGFEAPAHYVPSLLSITA